MLPSIVLVAAFLLGRAWFPQYLRNRYDWEPENRSSLASRLASKTGVRQTPSGTETVMLLIPNGNKLLTFRIQSVEGLDASPSAARRIEAYLRKKNYATVLNYPAFVTMHDSASLQWDASENLRVAYSALVRRPSSGAYRLFLEKLQL